MELLYEKYIDEAFDKHGVLKYFTPMPPDGFNFAYDVVDVLAARKPGKLALLWVNEKGDERRFTFSDVKRESDKAASMLRDAGIKKGDPVMLILKKHYQFWFAVIALHKLGAVAIPATHLLSKKDLVYRFNAASVKAVICTGEGEVAEAVDAAAGESPTLTQKYMVNGSRGGWLDFDAQCTGKDGCFERPAGEDAPKNTDMMILYFTSGTTGMPKMVCHDFVYPLGHVVTARHWHNVDPDGIHFTMADTGWAKSVWGKLYGQWLCEAAVFAYEYDKFSPSETMKMIQKYKITTFCAPPTIYRFFMNEGLDRFDLSSLKHATIAGEALNPDVFNAFKKHTGLSLMEGFGQTETTLTVCTLNGMEPKPGSMGKASPAWDVDIIDDDGNSCPNGVAGELVVRVEAGKKPCGMFMGYYRDGDLTNRVWHDGLYHTGDIAWRDEDGYFWYVGRTDDLIKSSGYRIGPFEIESVLVEHESVRECAVVGVPDPIRGQIVKAFVVLKSGFSPSEELVKELQEHVKTLTAPYKYPRIVDFVSELPKTISGKIRRVELRQSSK